MRVYARTDNTYSAVSIWRRSLPGVVHFLHSTMLYADVHGFDVDLWLQRSVELASWPIAVSYGFWEDKVLADPTGEEVCRLQVSIIVNLLQSIFARRPRV